MALLLFALALLCVVSYSCVIRSDPLAPVAVTVGINLPACTPGVCSANPLDGLPGAGLGSCSRSSVGPFLTAARAGEPMVWSAVASDRFQVSALICLVVSSAGRA
jgi:hypothetical protein